MERPYVPDRGKVDFSDVASGWRLPPVHPGEILRDEFLTPMKLSVYRLAQAIKVSRAYSEGKRSTFRREKNQHSDVKKINVPK